MAVVEDEKSNSGRPTAWIAVLLVGIPLLYFLSTGPLVRMYRNGPPSPAIDHFVQVFYAPIDWLWRKTPARAPLEKWVDLWR